jgi:hypothetical protein
LRHPCKSNPAERRGFLENEQGYRDQSEYYGYNNKKTLEMLTGFTRRGVKPKKKALAEAGSLPVAAAEVEKTETGSAFLSG